MTKQEMFNKVWDWFVVGKNLPSATIDDYCRYRGVNGAKCAIGIFIPDTVYNASMEGLAVRKLLQEYPELIPFVTPTDCDIPLVIPFLVKMQSAHDLAVVDVSEEVAPDFHQSIKRRLTDMGLQIPTI